MSQGLSTPSIIAPSGSVLQLVHFQDSNHLRTGTGAIGVDDTIPQSSEGTQIMTASITPLKATSKLLVEVQANLSLAISAAGKVLALFKDSETDARCAVWNYDALANEGGFVSLRYVMTAGTINSIVFKVRAAATSIGAVDFNGQSNARQFGGANFSWITISEIAT